MQDIAFGKERVRAWPTSRGRPKTKAQQEQLDKFALVQRMAAYIAPGVLAYIHKAVGNSPLLPRDVVTMMLYNRWMAFDLEDGRTLWPMTGKVDVSAALDVLTKQVGDYLIRTEAGWRGASTLPAQPSRVVQAAARMSGNKPGVNGEYRRVPFDVITGDPGGWWKGAPDYAWKPDTPGFYFFELHVRKLGFDLNAAWVMKPDLVTHLLAATDIPDCRSAYVSGYLYLDGDTAVTSGGWAPRAGTYEGVGTLSCYFKITGPF